MSEVPDNLYYTETHEWVREEPDGSVTVGISDYAQDALGDVVHVELPEHEAEFVAGEEACVVESVKAASELYAPITGVITEANETLESKPELVNEDPYGAGWFFRLVPEQALQVGDLLDAAAYEDMTEDE